MDGNGSHQDGPPPRKKARKGKKKSKAERLARGLSLTADLTCSSTTDVSFESLQALLAAPEATTSTHWDRAQAVAMVLNTTAAKQLMIRSLVFDRQAPKAAVHYVKRLGLVAVDLVDALVEGRDDPQRCLEVAKFLVDADTLLVDNATRISKFILPWLEIHKVDPVPVDEAAQPQPQLPSAFATAARLVLQPRPTLKKPQLVAEKTELQRALVRTLLTDSHDEDTAHAGVLLQYAASMAPVLAAAAAASVEIDPDVATTWADEALQAEQHRRAAIADRVEKSLQLMWPDARVLVFGSSATGLLLATADGRSSHDDVDLCAVLPSCPQFLDATATLVADVADHLALYGGGHDHVAVTRARVPIVKWTDASSQLQCDLCINNLPALYNTQLTMQLLKSRASVRGLSLWLKRWLKSNRAGFASALSSYGMQLLVLHFLQRTGVLPSNIDCEPLALDAAALRAAGIEREIQGKVQRAIQAATSETGGFCAELTTQCSPSLWSLVVGFFAFYGANLFDFERSVVSLRQTTAATKADKQWTRRHWRFSLSIEDPIELDRDLGALFSRVSLTRFRTALVAACVAIADTHDAGETSTEQGRARLLESLLATDPVTDSEDPK